MKNNREKRRSPSLTRTLSIAFLALSMSILVISTISQLYSSFLTQQASVYQRQQLIANDASQFVSNFFQEKFNVLATAVDVSSPANLNPGQKQVFLDSLLGLQPAFRQLLLLNNQDQLTATASRFTKGTAVTMREKLTSTDALLQLRLGQNYISPVYIDEATSEPLVIMAIPVTDIVGGFQGTLAVEVNLKFMWDLVDQLKVGETGYAYVVDETGRLIAYQDTSLVLKGENVSYIEEVQEFKNSLLDPKANKSDSQPHTGLAGQDALTTYAPLNAPQWAVVVELPVQEAYQGITSQAVQAVQFTLIVAILAIIGGFFMARRLVRPLTELTNAASQIAEGNLELQATARGPLEVESLGTAFNTMTSQLRNLIGSLEQRISERTADLESANQRNERRARQFEAIAQVARLTSASENLSEILPRLVTVISNQFRFYHTGIFLIDESRKYAILNATNSEGGKRMLERGHRLEVGATGIVGYVAATGKPRIALDTGVDAVYFNNPDLPETKSEAALPLIQSETVIGVLDVQSTTSRAFTSEDIETLSILANQVSVTIQNSRLYEQNVTALESAEQAYRQLSGETWKKAIDALPLKGYVFDGVRSEPLKESGRAGDSLSIPVNIRGQSVGALKLEPLNPDREWSEDELAMVTAAADRAALALESARLLQESQKRAAKERIIGEITAKISAQSEIDKLLKAATQELSRTMPGKEIAIQFRKEETE